MVFCSSAQLTQAHVLDAQHCAMSLLKRLPSNLFYHRQDHTLKVVVPMTQRIAQAEQCSPDQIILLTIAALFHDVGYIQEYQDNEEVAVQKSFFYMQRSPLPYTYEHAKIVQEAILATNLSRPLYAKHEKIIRDADLSTLGHADFWNWATQLQTELQQHTACPLAEYAKDNARWLRFEQQFLQAHRWQTKSAHNLFDKGKQDNLRKIRQLLEEKQPQKNQPTSSVSGSTLFERNTAPQRPVF